MGLLESHTVAFHRYQAGTKDALGNMTSTTEVSGWPVTTTGLFESSASRGAGFRSSRLAARDPEGLRTKRDSVFFSEYGGGRIGDYVTFRGASYLVLGVDDNRQEVGISHFEYSLARKELGNTTKYNEGDTEINPRV